MLAGTVAQIQAAMPQTLPLPLQVRVRMAAEDPPVPTKKAPLVARMS